MARLLVVLSLAVLAVACKGKEEPPAPGSRPTAPPKPGATPPGAGALDYKAVPRMDFNRLAVRLNLPVYWIMDADKDGAVDPREVASLRFYPTFEKYVDGERFTPKFDEAYRAIAEAQKTPPPDDARLRLVIADLDGARPTLVHSDLRGLSAGEKDFVRRMFVVADLIDDLFDIAGGTAAVASDVAKDPASQSAFRRNRGAKCATPAMEKEKDCSAIPGAPKVPFDIYPASIQQDDRFCDALAARPDAKTLLTPFTVVREEKGDLKPVPYNVAYADLMKKVAAELRGALAALPEGEVALKKYLEAAAVGFETNDWAAADEAWAAMNAANSRWYVRVAPDETYWEPCSRKAGFHLTFALINPESLTWQKKLEPLRTKMEQQIAARAGAPYQARKVSFHLPDFIDIVINAGDDRGPTGATIGQSLPNWGKVAEEGRGRTVMMSNLYTDPDSLAARRSQASSLLDAAALGVYVDDKMPGFLSTILHEASHNLGPSHDYRVKGKTDDETFGGPLAAMLEELKAQTGGIFLVELLRSSGVIDDELARRTYADSIVWAFGHIATGMYTAEGKPKAYSQLAAIQIGYLMDQGAITWDANATAANGTDKGAFKVDFARLPGAIDAMMKVVGGIKARGDVAEAKALVAKYVDGQVVPHKDIVERWARQPRVSFVYAVELE